MKTRNEKGRNQKAFRIFVTSVLVIAFLAGCGKKTSDEGALEDAGAGQTGLESSLEEAGAILSETASDAEIDFAALKEENPDVFGWLYVPGTEMDAPILQSTEEDDFYQKHDVLGKENVSGALYTELANLTNLCDFNTVIHGNVEIGAPFAELYRFLDPDYFKAHERAYVYLEGNLLTYEIFAAYEREDTSLIRTYDFTYASGCQQFLDELYTKSMGKNIRQGWDGITPYHFLITLTTKEDPNSDRQLVVVAALVGDAAGTIDRVVE